MFRIRPTLQRYVLREFALLFIVTLLAMCVFMLLMICYAMAAELSSYGADQFQVLLLSPFILPRAVVWALPPATMIAIVMVFGRLNAENEIIAAQAGGAPLWTMIWPLLFCGILISGASCVLAHWGALWGNDQIRSEVFKINKPEFFKNLDKPGRSISIRPDANTLVRLNMLPIKKNAAGVDIRPIQIVYFQSNRLGQTVLAQDHEFIVPDAASPATQKIKQDVADKLPKTAESITAALDRVLILRLKEVQVYGDRSLYADAIDWGVALPDVGAIIPIGSKRGEKSLMENFEEARKVAESESRRWKFLLKRAGDYGALAAAAEPLDVSSPGLIANGWYETRAHMDAVFGDGGALQRKRLEISEFHRKLSLSILPVFMVLLGVGLGLLVKKSNRMIGFLLGVALYVMLYYPMTILAKNISSAGQLGAYSQLSQYLPNAIFAFLGLILWRLNERGQFAVPWVAELARSAWNGVHWVFRGLWAVCSVLVDLPSRLFRRTADKYVGHTFLVPLLIIVFCIAGFAIVIDLLDHLNEIMDGIAKATEPQVGFPFRTQGQALRDVFAFYGIQSLEITLEFLPFEVLLAGMLCGMVLVRNHEHLILKSSGVRLQRALRPMMILTLLACLLVSATRELWMPELIMHREYLKPLVYHKGAQASALALSTLDKGKPILFEMSQYDPTARVGKDLRIYVLGDEKNKRIPVISADVAKWDGKQWELWTDPAVREMALLQQASFGSQTREPPKKPGEGDKPATLVRGGFRYKIDDQIAPEVATAQNAAVNDLRNVAVRRLEEMSWSGPIDPNFIDGERLGSSVMRLGELKRMSGLNPALMVDWYRRVSEFLMGFLLLWCALPLMFNDSSSGPIVAIGASVLIFAFYWGLCAAAANVARGNPQYPPWLALVPHGIFLLVGIWQFYIRMQT